MKKFVTAFLVCGALAVSACASHESLTNDADLLKAPYADERTVGHEKMVVTKKAAPKKAEKVFRQTQMK